MKDSLGFSADTLKYNLPPCACVCVCGCGYEGCFIQSINLIAPKTFTPLTHFIPFTCACLQSKVSHSQLGIFIFIFTFSYSLFPIPYCFIADTEENDHVSDVQKKVRYTQACVINLNPPPSLYWGNIISYKLAHFRFASPKCVKSLNLQLMQSHTNQKPISGCNNCPELRNAKPSSK